MSDHAERPYLEVKPRAAWRLLGTPVHASSNGKVQLATLENLAAALRTLSPGQPGLAFFRAHHDRRDGDPSISGLDLQNATFQAGMLWVTDGATGQPILPVPSRVILSCCSSAPTAERSGAESLGLVSGCLRSGANHVFATGVDVPNASFTNAWDDMLIELMLTADDPVRALRDLQLRMLREWQVYSLRGSADDMYDIRDPLPIVWAYYQAYGI